MTDPAKVVNPGELVDGKLVAEQGVVMSGVPEPETAMLREIRKQCLQNAADLLRRGTREALAFRDEVNAVANTIQALIDDANPGQIQPLPPGLLQTMGAVAERVQRVLD
jgi:hypothetical protein